MCKAPLCGYCGKVSEKVTGKVVYPLRSDLRNKIFYACLSCDAFIGCHPGTDIPLGTLAGATLRKKRSRAHAAFDPLWKGRFIPRKKAYAMLAKYLGVSVDNCHIGMFDMDTCEKVITFSHHYMDGQISMEFMNV